MEKSAVKLLGIILLFSLVGFLSACKTDSRSGGEVTPVTPPPGTGGGGTKTLSYIFKSGTEGYSCFRIPAIIKSKNGTLLAFAEARRNNCSDENDIDMVVKRSTDNGKTWGSMILIWSDGGNTCGNPSPVVDQATGKIVLLMSWNLGSDKLAQLSNGTSVDTRRAFVTSSMDDGLTWVPVKEITSSVKNPAWGWYATGPGHAIQISGGKYANRLVVPCDYIDKVTGKGYSHVIYSDDAGTTWVLGGTSRQEKVSESTVSELSDGRLMLNMRSSSGTRMVAYSTDGGQNWSDNMVALGLVDPNCQGSLLSQRLSNAYNLFFSNPASSARELMTIKMSVNDGSLWSKLYKVYSGPSAYSDIVMVSDTQIGILYEAGISGPYEGLVFETVAVSDFK